MNNNEKFFIGTLFPNDPQITIQTYVSIIESNSGIRQYVILERSFVKFYLTIFDLQKLKNFISRYISLNGSQQFQFTTSKQINIIIQNYTVLLRKSNMEMYIPINTEDNLSELLCLIDTASMNINNIFLNKKVDQFIVTIKDELSKLFHKINSTMDTNIKKNINNEKTNIINDRKDIKFETVNDLYSISNDIVIEKVDQLEPSPRKEVSNINEIFDNEIDNMIASGEVDYVKEEINHDIEKIVVHDKILPFNRKNYDDLDNYLLDKIKTDNDIDDQIIKELYHDRIGYPDYRLLFYRYQYVYEKIHEDNVKSTHILPLYNDNTMNFDMKKTITLLVGMLRKMIKDPGDGKVMLLYKTMLMPYLFTLFKIDKDAILDTLKRAYNQFLYSVLDIEYNLIEKQFLTLYNILNNKPDTPASKFKNDILKSKLNNDIYEYDESKTLSDNIKEYKKWFKNKDKIKNLNKEDNVKIEFDDIQLSDDIKELLEYDKLSDELKDKISKILDLIFNKKITFAEALKLIELKRTDFYIIPENILRIIYHSPNIKNINDKNEINNSLNMSKTTNTNYEIISFLLNFC